MAGTTTYRSDMPHLKQPYRSWDGEEQTTPPNVSTLDTFFASFEYLNITPNACDDERCDGPLSVHHPAPQPACIRTGSSFPVEEAQCCSRQDVWYSSSSTYSSTVRGDRFRNPSFRWRHRRGYCWQQKQVLMFFSDAHQAVSTQRRRDGDCRRLNQTRQVT